jgi:hypothetical protein
MASHKPTAKLISFKLIVFVNFIQSLIFQFISGESSITNGLGDKFTFNDLSIGLPNLILCVEMSILSFAMHFTYRSREYHPNNGRKRLPVWKALLDSFNVSDIAAGTIKIPFLIAGGALSSGNKRTMTMEGYERQKHGSDAEPMAPYGAPPAGTQMPPPGPPPPQQAGY